jgi:hypothetical protein
MELRAVSLLPCRRSIYIFRNIAIRDNKMAGIFFHATVAILLPLAMSAEARADDPMAMPSKCTTMAEPTGELAPWSKAVPLAAAGDAGQQPALAVGQAAEVTLLLTPQVHYPLRPEKPGGPVSYGGLIGVEVKDAATYRVALSSGAWIDLVHDAKAVTSVAHGHGPACTGVRKMVDFPLTPGRYTLQLGANGEEQMKVLVARLP